MRAQSLPHAVAGFFVIALVLIGFGLPAVKALGLGPSWGANTGVSAQLQSCVPDTDLGYIYCISGNTGGSSYTNVVNYVQTQSGGALGKWNATTTYPYSEAGLSCANYQFFIYCVGGYDGSSRTGRAYFSQLSASGLGTWQAATAYPTSIELQSCAAYSGYLYCFGGYDGSRYYNSTYSAKLSSTGGIGTWTKTTSYPTTIAEQSCAVSAGYIYCVGGRTNSTAVTAASYYAQLTSSGGVGVWSAATAYPTPDTGQSCTVVSGYIYCVGGTTSTGYTNAVYYASVASTGVGTWYSTTIYPSKFYDGSCVNLNGYIYCIGGFDGSAVIANAYSSLPSVTITTTSTVMSTVTSTTTSTVTNTTTAFVVSTSTSFSTYTSVSLTTFISTTLVTSTVNRTSISTSLRVSTVTSASTISISVPVTTTVTAQSPQQPANTNPFIDVGVGIGGLLGGLLIAFAILRLRKRGTAEPEAETESEEDTSP